MFPPRTKFLVVDDMATFRAMVRQSLTDLGYRNIVEASNGQDAYTTIVDAEEKMAPFDLILCDWNMPKMTGIDLLKKVREQGWGKALPFVLLTAEAELANVKAALELSVTGYIVKPVSANTLRDKLQGVYTKLKGP